MRYRCSGDRFGAPFLVSAVLACVCLLWSTSCRGGPQPREDDESIQQPERRPIEADDAGAEAKFEQALERLRAGEWAEARESFRLIQSEYAGDSIADLAELYVARAHLKALRPPGPGGGTDAKREGEVPAEAGQILASLARAEGVDGRVRRAARLYRAVARARAGRHEQAWDGLSDFPEPVVGSGVLEQDRLVVWPVLVEALHRAGRGEATVVAAARYDADLRARREATGADGDAGHRGAGLPETTEQRDDTEDSKKNDLIRTQRNYARQRAFEAASQMPVSKLEGLAERGDAFVTATAGWALLSRQLTGKQADGEWSEKKRKAIEERYRNVSRALVDIHAEERVEELSVLMATKGGSDRLAIGAALPLSGNNEAVGRRAMRGMLLAMEAFESRSAPRVTLVFGDSMDGPEAVLEDLDAQGVSAVVGPLDTGRARAFAKAARARSMPMIALTTSYPGEREEPQWVFHNFMDPGAEARAAAEVAFEKLGDRRVAVLYPNIDYGRLLRKVFAARIRQLGGSVVVEAQYDRKASNFTSVARKVAAANPEAVFIPDTAEKVAELTAFLADQNIWGAGEERPDSDSRTYVHYLGTSLWHDAILYRQAKSYVDRPIVPVWFAPSFDDKATTSFDRRFRATFSRPAQNIEAFGYDAVRWVRALIVDRGLHRRESLRDALVDGAKYRGATGAMSYDADGMLRRTLRFVTVGGEGFEPLPYQVSPRMTESADSEESGGEVDAEKFDNAGDAPVREDP